MDLPPPPPPLPKTYYLLLLVALLPAGVIALVIVRPSGWLGGAWDVFLFCLNVWNGYLCIKSFTYWQRLDRLIKQHRRLYNAQLKFKEQMDRRSQER